jgi:hypothetical protein
MFEAAHCLVDLLGADDVVAPEYGCRISASVLGQSQNDGVLIEEAASAGD